MSKKSSQSPKGRAIVALRGAFYFAKLGSRKKAMQRAEEASALGFDVNDGIMRDLNRLLEEHQNSENPNFNR